MTQITLDIRELGALNAQLARLSALDLDGLTADLALQGESQTRRRISDEKTGPDGAAWPEWSEGYAATRHGGQSLLESDGHLIASLESGADGDTAWWGSDMVYAATHQFGDASRNIPARPYLGISAQNKRELADLIDHFLRGVLPA